MKASLVDVVGNVVPHTDVMLHHVVFAKLGVNSRVELTGLAARHDD